MECKNRIERKGEKKSDGKRFAKQKNREKNTFHFFASFVSFGVDSRERPRRRFVFNEWNTLCSLELMQFSETNS